MAGSTLQARSAAGFPRLGRWLLAAGLTLGLAAGLTFGLPAPAQARETPPDSDSLPTVALTQLPAQARDTHGLIRAGGPFPHAKDGTVFGNRERLLPGASRGYYREYTVRTPGLQHRGARRLVCGGLPPTAPKACYYTEDHYASFRRVIG